MSEKTHAEIIMDGNLSVQVHVENLNAGSSEMGFAKELVDAVEKFATKHVKGEKQ